MSNLNLDQDSIQLINDSLRMASLIKIDNLVINDGDVRAMDNDSTVLMVLESDKLNTSGKSIGVTRVKQLKKLLEVANTTGKDNVVIDLIESQHTANEIGSIKVSSKKVKFEYRAAKVDPIPRGLAESWDWVVKMDQEAVGLISQGASSIKTDKFILTSKPGNEGVFAELRDEDTNDVFSIKVADAPTAINEPAPEKNTFVYYYQIQSILPLIKEVASTGEDVFIQVSTKGFLQVNISDVTFYVFPTTF